MFAGLSAGCRDLRASADDYYDRQNLYDIRIQSTLGLTNEDVKAVSQVKGVEKACGTYSETALVQAGDLQQKAEVTLLDMKGFNQPLLLEGTLPQSASEIAVSQNYCTDAGKKIGDQVTLTAQRTSGDEDTSALKQHSYTITAIMQDAADLIADDGAASFRSSQSAKYFFYVTSDALDNEVYSAIELSVRGAKNLSCFSKEYQDKVDAVKKQIEKEIKEMPNYFSDYNTTVHFITEEELERDHSGIPHGGFVFRTGVTGWNKENKHVIEYSLKLDSNPEFTSSVIVAYARAINRLYQEGQTGCKTVFDIAPAYLSPLSGEELRAHLL